MFRTTVKPQNGARNCSGLVVCRASEQRVVHRAENVVRGNSRLINVPTLQRPAFSSMNFDFLRGSSAKRSGRTLEAVTTQPRRKSRSSPYGKAIRALGSSALALQASVDRRTNAPETALREQTDVQRHCQLPSCELA